MTKLTPAMKQYMDIKNNYKDCIVFFRMGDFYETFYDDAKTTSRVLDIALTKRGIKNSEQSIPLAGIPHHALDSYLSKMIKNGYKVAIVEQLEDPKDAKGIVDRGVVRIVTPGTVIDEKMLTNENNFIACFSIDKKYGLSLVDISTGEFFTTQSDKKDTLLAEISKYNPSEIVLPMSYEDSKISTELEEKGYYLSFISDVDFYEDNALENLKKHFDVVSLEGFGLKGKDMAVSASGALLSYLMETQKTTLGHIRKIEFLLDDDYLHMDSTSIKNLELFENLRDGSKKGTLLNTIDRTLTPMGGRLLRQFMLNPLIKKEKIDERLVAVEELFDNNFILQEFKDLLKNMSDIERLISRINYGNTNPRDLVMLHGSVDLVPEILSLLSKTESSLFKRLSKMSNLNQVAELIDNSIKDDPPTNILDGGFIKTGYNHKLDRLRNTSKDAKKIIWEMEKEEREKTKIKSLKIRFNKVFGYFIEVTKPNLDKVPDHYVKKQTLVNCERFITDELKKLEEEILTAEENIIRIEKELFEEIIEKIRKQTEEIQKVANNVAYLDVICSFSSHSKLNNYTRPEITENYDLSLVESRHPVVEKITDFVSNDIHISKENRVMIITGPNMAGKSVFMRQIALNVLLTQMGCFIPAKKAILGVIDKIFCRTGAIDDISQGQSTFMVEMSETAQILNSATEKSLIILDEIGRGTSTYDGVAIAWAVADHIARKIESKTLFATHYHVLNNLEKEVRGVKNYNIAVKEKDEDIIFLRKILRGGTDKSYGIHVAKLAGMPTEVIDKSREIQFKLEKEDEISEKIIVETKKKQEKDKITEEIEEVDRLVKSKQMTLDEL